MKQRSEQTTAHLVLITVEREHGLAGQDGEDPPVRATRQVLTRRGVQHLVRKLRRRDYPHTPADQRWQPERRPVDTLARDQARHRPALKRDGLGQPHGHRARSRTRRVASTGRMRARSRGVV